MGAYSKARNDYRRLLVRLQDRRCPYCWKRMSRNNLIGPPAARRDNPRRATLDHVWPRGRHGSEYKGRSVAVHRDCNSGKGDRDPTGCELIALAWVNALLERHHTQQGRIIHP